MMARPFHCQQHRSAPLTPDANTLDHSQYRQDDGTPNANGFVCRNKCDEKCCNSHAQERGDERPLTADAVAIMAEYRGPDWPADEANEIGTKGRERRGQRILIGEVKLPEDETGCCAVDEKVVPFDGRADCR